MNIDKVLLTQVLNNDMLNLNEIRDLVDTMTRMKLEELYTQAKEERKVWKGEGKDKRWKFKKDDGTLVAKTSEEKIKEAFIEYQKEMSLEGQKNKMTFGDLYQEWLDYKKEQVGLNKGQLSPSTYRRYQRDYERYIKDTSFDDMLISSITPIDIEKFLKSIIVKHNLCKTGLTNIMGYLRSNMLYACKKELLQSNPCLFVDLKSIKGFCKSSTHNDSDRILSNEDMAKLIATLHKKQSEDDLYIQNYAIELACMCGMRVGELSALKWECVKNDVLRIEYSEHRLDFDDRPCEYYIGETKNRKTREFPMSDEMKDLFERIRNVHKKYRIASEFVFVNLEGRVNSHTITCAMARRCVDANIDVKSIHAIRRTISSHLRTLLPLASVASLLGHLEETNEKHYNYDVLTQKHKLECVTQMYKTYSKVA